MAYGYTGRILRVDLCEKALRVEEQDELFYRTYMGGWGIIAHYLLRELPQNVDPLAAENLLVFASGIMTGVAMAGSGRSAMGAKSPRTGGFGAAEVGGWWGAELVRAGFDAVVVTGRAEKPVYLWIHDGEAEIRSAEHVWARCSAETQAALRDELGDRRARVAQIGPAGEQLAPIANVIYDVNRTAGRTGLGAVMGSKKLKAVVVRGTRRKDVANPQALRELARWYSQFYKTTWTAGMQDIGTAGGVTQHEIGGLPTLNFQKGTFDQWERITGDRMRDTILKDRHTCFACPVRCKRVVQVQDGPFPVDPVYGGPEYETIGAFGSLCGIGELPAIARANQLCNAYGLDTISCGVSIAWAMECFERGLLTSKDTAGLEIRFGNSTAMVQLVDMMGRREGFGRLLSKGASQAAAEIGRGTEKYAMHVRGQEIPLHEPRVKFGLGIGYAVSPTGADHMHNFHDVDYVTEESISDLKGFGILKPLPAKDLSPAKMRLASILIPWSTLANVICCCSFVFASMPRRKVQEVVEAITGWDTSLYELHQAGERAYSLARLFNAREGLNTDGDRLPARFFEAFREGPSAGNALPREQFERARMWFYEMMGWDQVTGAPTECKLHQLGVGWASQWPEAKVKPAV
jgi:aldehyde:ferredoxin oxidoreductase